tara:strand:- start:93364 stop:94023 length:660 start_codon:yes stop_codon:yes gene_type:complete
MIRTLSATIVAFTLTTGALAQDYDINFGHENGRFNRVIGDEVSDDGITSLNASLAFGDHFLVDGSYLNSDSMDLGNYRFGGQVHGDIAFLSCRGRADYYESLYFEDNVTALSAGCSYQHESGFGADVSYGRLMTDLEDAGLIGLLTYNRESGAWTFSAEVGGVMNDWKYGDTNTTVYGASVSRAVGDDGLYIEGFFDGASENDWSNGGNFFGFRIGYRG